MRNEHRDNARGDAADWRLAQHEFHLATPADSDNEPRPYPVAVPLNGPDPTDPAAAPFLPLACPRPSAAERLSTAAALERFGFRCLQQAVLACRRRERNGMRASATQEQAARTAVARIEQLVKTVTNAAPERIDVSFDSPRRMPAMTSGGARARIRLRIDGRMRETTSRPGSPLTIDVDPAHPLVNPRITAAGVRIDIAPPAIGRLARMAATDTAGFRPPAPPARTLIGIARAHAAKDPIRVFMRSADEASETRVETCTVDDLPRVLLGCCWPQLTPKDADNAWVMQLRKTHHGRQTVLARYDRKSGSIRIEGEAFDPRHERAVAGLVAALRAAGRSPGEKYWTHHRTEYPTGIETC